MIKRFFLLFFLFPLFLMPASDAKGSVSKVKLSPKTIRTGDRCFLRITCGDDLSPDDALHLSVEESPWLYISDIKLNHEEDEILIWFVPLDPSMTIFPPVRTAGRFYSGIRFTVKPMLHETSSLNPPPGKVLLPWTRVLFAALVASAVSAFFTVWYLVKEFKNRAEWFIKDAISLGKKRRLLSLMSRALGKGCVNGCVDLSRTIVGLFKEYLEISGYGRMTCLTTAEIIRTMEKVPHDELYILDEIRFAPDWHIPALCGRDDKNTKAMNAVSALYEFALALEGPGANAPAGSGAENDA